MCMGTHSDLTVGQLNYLHLELEQTFLPNHAASTSHDIKVEGLKVSGMGKRGRSWGGLHYLPPTWLGLAAQGVTLQNSGSQVHLTNWL